MASREYISRNEVFGKTVFDIDSFRFVFMSNEQYEAFRAQYIVDEMDNELFHENPLILSAPIRSYFDTTLECNLRCITCLNSSGKPLANELDTGESLKVVENLRRDGVFNVKFSGGETTQREDWFDVMSRAQEVGLVIAMNSNGLYAPENLDKLIELHPSEVTISLDGHKHHNDLIRGKGSFSKAVNSIEALSEAGVRVCINTVVTSLLDESDIRGLIEIANEHCYDISFFHARPIGRAVRIKSKLPNYKELNAFMQRVDEIKKEYSNTRIETRSHSLRENILGTSAESVGLMTGGTDGFTRFNIMPTGKLYAGGCTPYVGPETEVKVVLGNIRDYDYSILPVWRESQRLWDIRYWSHELQERCNGCSDYKTDCSGFTLDMELYRESFGENPYCKY